MKNENLFFIAIFGVEPHFYHYLYYIVLFAYFVSTAQKNVSFLKMFRILLRKSYCRNKFNCGENSGIKHRKKVEVNI